MRELDVQNFAQVWSCKEDTLKMVQMGCLKVPKIALDKGYLALVSA